MSAKKKNAARRKPKQMTKVKSRNPLMPEVISIFAIAAGVLVLISLFTENSAGFIGAAASGFLLGIMGLGAYFIPFAIIAAGVYVFMSVRKSIPTIRIISAFLLLLFIISLTHILNHDPYLTYGSVTEYIRESYAAGSAGNGGLIGAVLGNFLLNITGKAGSIILISAGVIVSAIFVTGRSFTVFLFSTADGIRNIFSNMSDDYDEQDDYEEKPAPPPRSRSAGAVRANSNSSSNNARKKQDDILSFKKKATPKTFVIEDKKDEKNNKILLVNEELRPKGAKKAAILEFTPKNINPEDKLTHPVISSAKKTEPVETPIEIKVTGLIEDKPDDKSKETIPLFGNASDIKFKPVKEPEPEDDDYYGKYDPEDDIYDEDYEHPEYDDEKAIFAGGVDYAEGLNCEEDLNYEDDEDNEEIEDEIPFKALNPPVAKFTGGAKPLFESKNTPPKIEYKRYDPEDYEFPSVDLLIKNPHTVSIGSRAQILENSRKLEDTLKNFGVEARVIEVSKGPTVTRYELSPGQGVKVSSISRLSDDLALNLAATGIRIEAPIPGKAAVGIEVPNKEVTPVYLREVIDDDAFKNFPSKLAFALGKDIAGNTVVADIAKMPHLLIAGATGSGKSICVNALITSIIYKARPDEVKLLMVDPKVVELTIYNGIPHLLIPVVTDPKKAAGALNWAVAEMISRYNLFAQTSVRDLKGYNNYIAERGETELLPQIVIIIDELADLMMAAPGEVEDAICRLAQMARAAGLHLIIATQRPSVDVITGLIKANIPSRLAFSVSSGTDSRTVLDMVGAEKLLGKGDMLFYPVGMGKPLRVQGAYISDKEVENIVSFVKQGNSQDYDQEMIDRITASGKVGDMSGEVDEFFDDAVEFVIQKEKASASMLQRQFRIGYNRASRLIEDLEVRGIVGPEDGSKPRKVLMTYSQWQEYKSNEQSS